MTVKSQTRFFPGLLINRQYSGMLTTLLYNWPIFAGALFFGGVALARELDLPFILEYNGSEVWVARNWGRPLRFERIAKRIEMLNFHAADLITAD